MSVLATLPVVQFVIGLREGVEAALVVGIVGDVPAPERTGVRCAGCGPGSRSRSACASSSAAVLEIVDQNLPQRQQEGFEAIVGLIAVAMVTYMIVYMRRHAREMGGELRASAARRARGRLGVEPHRDGVPRGHARGPRDGALPARDVPVLRRQPARRRLGALPGCSSPSAIGWGIYRGGVRLDLARFFRVTGVVLVIIAAGLLSSAVHTPPRPGCTPAWATRRSTSAVIVPSPDSVTTGLITGLLGIYPFPTDAEVLVLAALRGPDARVRPRPAPFRDVDWTPHDPHHRAPARCSSRAAAALAACGGSDDTTASTTASAAPAKELRFELTDDGLHAGERQGRRPGAVKIVASNPASTKTDEIELKNADGIILGERENLAPGLSARLHAQPAARRATRSTARSANAQRDNGKLTVTGDRVRRTTADDALLAAAVADYRAYVEKRDRRARRLDEARSPPRCAAGDLAKAKELFGPTRVPLRGDRADRRELRRPRPGDRRARQRRRRPAKWTGFHRIEQILWRDGTTKGTAPLRRRAAGRRRRRSTPRSPT